MFKEAAAIAAEGLATPETIDAVVRTSFGFRLPLFGPFAIADMAGLDVYAGAYAALEAGLGERLAAPAGLTERVERGELGTKTGEGFLPLTAEDAKLMVAWRDEAYVALSKLLDDLGPWKS
jgi:3-hydroxybutyryl-CoA dehydrogenase